MMSWPVVVRTRAVAQSDWGSSTERSVSSAVVQSFTDLSAALLTRVLPSGVNASFRTEPS